MPWASLRASRSSGVPRGLPVWRARAPPPMGSCCWPPDAYAYCAGETFMIPGEIFPEDGDIELNVGRATCCVDVVNTGDRPLQVCSHYVFCDVISSLDIVRLKSRGLRLNITAGTAVRFDPGQLRTVELVALAGDRRVFGFHGDVMGALWW